MEVLGESMEDSQLLAGMSLGARSTKSNFWIKPDPLLVLQLSASGEYVVEEMENYDILESARERVPRHDSTISDADTDGGESFSGVSSKSNLDFTSQHDQEHLARRSQISQISGFPTRFQGTLQPRDIRLFDKNFSNSHDPEIIVRRHSILINLEAVKALLFYDKCLIIIPDGADSLLGRLLQKFQELYQIDASTSAFEIRALESIFITVCCHFEDELEELRPVILLAINNLLNTTSGVVVEKLRQIDADLTGLAARVKLNCSALHEVLQSDRDMALMNLSVLQQFPERFMEKLIELWQFDHEEVELVIEAYLQRLDAVATSIKSLQEQLASARASTSLRLSTAQNKLLSVDLLVSSVTAAGTYGALCAAVFGMNLESGVDQDPYWFWSVFGIIAGGVPLLIVAMFCFIKKRGLLIT